MSYYYYLDFFITPVTKKKADRFLSSLHDQGPAISRHSVKIKFDGYHNKVNYHIIYYKNTLIIIRNSYVYSGL